MPLAVPLRSFFFVSKVISDDQKSLSNDSIPAMHRNPMLLPFSLILDTLKNEIYPYYVEVVQQNETSTEQDLPKKFFQSVTASCHNNIFLPEKFAKKQFLCAAKAVVRCSEIFDIPEISIHSRYILKQTLGSGTWSTVLLAVDRQSNIERAVKKIPKRYISELNRFRREIQCHKNLDHPNIVRLYETFEDSLNIYMVLERCKGGELFDKLQQVGRFGEQVTAHLLYQILSSLAYCHSHSIAHRDLKLENLLFIEEDVQSTIKLIDFGLSKRFGRRMDQKMHSRVGTLYYTSPQVLAGSYNHLQCDMWATGVLLYMLLSGRPPFHGRNDAELMSMIQHGPLSFDGEEWKVISPLCKDLILLLLNRNTTDHLTAKAALEHPWFKLILHPHLQDAYPFFLRCASSSLTRSGSESEIPITLSLIWDSRKTFKQRKYVYSKVQNYNLPTFSRSYEACGSYEEWLPLCYCDISKILGAENAFNFSTYEHSFFDESAEKKVLSWIPPHFHISEKLIILLEAEEAFLYSFVPILERILQKWMNYIKFSHLKKAILSFIAYEMEESTDELKCLSNLFLSLDQDHDGFLSEVNLWQSLERLYSFKFLNRFAKGYQNQECVEAGVLTDLLDNAIFTSIKLELKDKMKSLADILSVLHVEGDTAFLDFAQFLAASVSTHIFQLERACRVSFRTIDLNSDGQVDIDELIKAFSSNIPVLQQLHQMKNNSATSEQKCCFNFEDFMAFGISD